MLARGMHIYSRMGCWKGQHPEPRFIACGREHLKFRSSGAHHTGQLSSTGVTIAAIANPDLDIFPSCTGTYLFVIRTCAPASGHPFHPSMTVTRTGGRDVQIRVWVLHQERSACAPLEPDPADPPAAVHLVGASPRQTELWIA